MASVGRDLVIVCSFSMLAAIGCGKKEAKPAAANHDFFPQQEKVDYSQIKVEAPPVAAPEAPKADTWATRVRDQVKTVHDDLLKCRNDFLIPFQFARMRHRNVEFISLQDMDELCYDGSPSKKTRGPWKILRAMSDEQMGKNADLDRFLALATDSLEHYHILSVMTKKVGAPEIDIVTTTAQEARDRMIAAAGALDKAAEAIAKWPDGQQADDDPQVVGKEVDAATFKAQLLDTDGFFMTDLASAYDRFANKSWIGYNMPKMHALRLWVAIPQKRLQVDRLRLAHVTADDKQKAEFKKYFDAVEAAGKAVAAGFDRYEKTPKDERSDKDPNRKAVDVAQQAALRIQAGWVKK